MEALTYFEALTYIQGGIQISRKGHTLNEREINELFFDVDDEETIEFKVHENTYS